VELTELEEVTPAEEFHIERVRRGLKVGVKVQLSGLTSAAGQPLNGRAFLHQFSG
jgi:hypothetical protein